MHTSKRSPTPPSSSPSALHICMQVNEMASKHHPHLVRLLGFCIDYNEATEQTEQILIYEFMPNGDLECWLGPAAAQPLSLLQRLDVMIGVAEGLQYLHSFGIVHRDIKPANILLDCNLQVAPFIAANDGVTFKDPALDAPPDIILRLARLALSCTAMPTVLRPNLIKILAELEAMREEVSGATRNRMARRIDMEIDDKQGHNLEEEVANAIKLGSSGDGEESKKRSE
ncbi:unnamed protein product [Closterium sp. NIES-65]|nr:unnamed protein product [Closterium sp. NIES-65]